jgi:hypothetical protein
MKKFIITSILAVLIAAGTTTMAQDWPDEYLGLPGDNLNLYAVMKLFQESETLEGFERSLNDEDYRINNLDLNGDNLVDYIMVLDYVDGDVHNVVLRVALNQNEYQDVAVFTVQRFRNGSVQIQLIGDEALYGRNYIVEPIYDDNYGETPNPGYIGRPVNRVNITVIRTTPFEIAAWPLIRFIYRPTYVIWRSSWYWGYYPSYWHPWRPFYWHYYYGYHYKWYTHYYKYYRHWQHHRYTRYNDFYYSSIRSHSPQVSTRIKEGNYKTTYSHPEQRRDGEALYAKIHSGQNTRTQDKNAINNQGRRSVSQSTQNRTSAGTSSGTAPRTTTTVNNRSVTKPSSGQSATDRRSTTTAASRSVTKPSSGQSTKTARTSRQSTKSVSSSVSRSRRDSKTATAAKKSDNTKKSETSKSSRRK